MAGTPGARILFCVASLALIGAAACSGVSDSTTQAGGRPAPLTLTMGTDDRTGTPAAAQVAEFARQVRIRSGGALVIQPVHRAVGPTRPAWDQRVARAVVGGDLDLGMVPSRAWDTEGVRTLRPLNAPLLVTSDATLDAVVTDDDLAGDLMAGLDEVGVTGLALVPEGLRHLFLYGATTLGARDLEGLVVRSPRSATSWAFLRQLGARPTDELETDFPVAESSFAVAPRGARRTAVGDVTLFAKVNVAVVNTGTWDDLDEVQRGILRKSATATRDWAVATNETDAVQAAAWCAEGQGDVTRAGAGLVTAVRTAAGTVLDDLRADPVTAGLVDRVARVAGNEAGPRLSVCRRSQVGTVTAADLQPRGGALPDGTYRVRFTDGYLRGRVRGEELVVNNHGTWTLTLRDGHWSLHQVAPDIVDDAEGVYEVRGGELYWGLEEQQVLHLRWAVDDDGDLHFRQLHDFGADADVDVPFPDFQFGREWVRVD